MDKKSQLERDIEAAELQVNHETHLYVVDHIYLDQASYNLYHLFLHCDYCGKPIKLCVKTENDIIKWLGGEKK